MKRKTNKKWKRYENSHYTRHYEPTGRKCRICGDEIQRIKDKENIIIFDDYFHCHKNRCQVIWEIRDDIYADNMGVEVHYGG